jgi:hypothetical protein
MITFIAQPEHEDLNPGSGPHVTFRVAPGRRSDGPWTAVALPVAELPTFYWAAQHGGWSVDNATLDGELKDLQLDPLEVLFGPVRPVAEHTELRVSTWYGCTVLEAL